MNRQTEKTISLRQGSGQKTLMQSQLSWSSSAHNVVVSGASEISTLSKLKNVILSLRKDWSSQFTGGIRVEGQEDYDKRLLLLQSQVEGLLKRKINFTSNDQTGQRVLDYSSLLNEKENQIVQLEKKIQNLESKLRRFSAREVQLEDSIVRLTEDLKIKEGLIALKHNSAIAQLAISTAFRDAFNRVKRNIDSQRYKLGDVQKIIMEGVIIPQLGSLEIKAEAFSQSSLASRSRLFQQETEPIQLKTRLVQFFREFERLLTQTQRITDFEIQRIIEGFLLNMTETKLYEKVQFSLQRYRQIQDYKRLKENFTIAAGIFADSVAQLRAQNVGYRLPKQIDNLFQLLQREKVTAIQVDSKAIFIDIGVSSKIIEVPVQDARTKHLIHLLSHQLKRLFLKYPTIQGEIDAKLAEFLQQQIIDVIEADEIQKLIQIVKFVPQIIRVENVYTHSTEKERKLEFHLRILLKALLQQLQKIKLKTGVVLEIDEGVIGMIKAQIMDTVNVDDILKVFRVTPKIVQVEKIIEKIVQRIVEVPKVVTVDKIVEKIVQVQKIKQVQRIVHVPIDKPMIVQTEREKLVPYQKKVETVVQVPTIVQKLVQVQKVVSQVMQVEVIKQKIVQVQVPVHIQRIVNHIQTEYQQIQVATERVVTVEKIIEKIVEVPVFVQKIVQKIVEIPKIIEVQKIVEKIVQVVQYRTARQVENHIEVKYQIVDRIVEKIVPIIQIKQRIKQVPQIIQVIKQVNNIITEIKEVEVIRQKLVIQQQIKEVKTVQTKLVEVIKQVIRQVEKFVEVPIIKQIPVIKQLIVQKPVIQRIESVHIKEVILKVPFIVKEPTIVEVQKYVNVYVQVPKMVKYIEEKIVEVPTIIDRIKEVPVIVQKIIEKMVEVPKVVEVQKIVQKIVVVPRVIEKVVEVPQIIEKVIEKEVIRQKIIEIEKIVYVPVIKQVVKQVQVIKNIFIQIEKPVEKIVERAVQVQKVEQKIITRQVLREVPINVIQQVPVEIAVQKIVPFAYQCVKAIQVQRHIIVPFQIPVPVQVSVQKIVPRQEIIQRIIPTPQIMEKIVPVVETVVQIQQIEKVIEKILIEKQIKEIEKVVPYIQQVIKQVPTIIEKIVTVEKHIDNIVTVEKIIEKVIQKTITLPQVYQVERIREKLVQVPKLVEIERVVPQIIKVNQYIQKIVQKLIEVPTIIQSIKEVFRQQEKIVPLKETTTQIVQVERCVQKLVYAQKLKEVVRNVNYIEKVLQIIDRIQQMPVAITTTEEKFIQVPYILQKIVEKIVIMPQIVEVLKYVHEVCQVNNVGVAVDIDVGVHELKYKELTKNIELHLDSVLKELRYLKSDQVTRGRIQKIQNFLQQLRKFILVPRIVKVVEQRIVEKQVQVDKLVKLAVQDELSVKKELSLSILIQKLIVELKRVKQKSGLNLQLDEDIKLIFFSQLNANVALDGDLYKKLQSYTQHINRQFQSLGHWSYDHQLMLNSFLQQRFLMAQLLEGTNYQLQQAKAVSQQNSQFINKFKGEASLYASFLAKISTVIKQNRPVNQIIGIIEEFDKYQKTSAHVEQTYFLGDLKIDNQRFESLLRQRQAEITQLKDRLFIQQKGVSQTSLQQEGIIKVLRAQIDTLRNENNNLLALSSTSNLLQSYKRQIQDCQARNLQLEGEISRLNSANYNLLQEKSLIMQNISFKRQPESAFQEVDIRQSGFGGGSRYSQSSQGVSVSQYDAEGRSTMPQYTQSVLVKPGQSQIRESSRKGIVQPFQSGLSQSGARFEQAYQQSPYQAALQGQSSIYAQKPGISETALYQSQKRESDPVQYQSYPLGERYQGTIGSQISGSQVGGSQIGGSKIGGSQIGGSQVGRTQTARPQFKTFGVEQSQSSKHGQGSMALRGQLEGRATLSQSGILQGTERVQGPVITQTQSRVEQSGYPITQSGTYPMVQGVQSGLYGQTARIQGTQGLYASRQQSSTIIAPSTQSIYQQGQGQGQSRGYASGTQGFTQGLQGLGTSGYQSSIYSTPIQSYKFTSPSPSGAKLTESIVKQQESLSKLQAQTPEVTKKEDPSKSQYRYYYREQPKKQ